MSIATRFNLGIGVGHKVDIMFLTDATGSMQGAIDNIKSNIIFGWDVLRHDTKWDIQLGISFYRDKGENEVIFEVLQEITGNTNAIQDAVSKLIAKGGGDRDEAQIYALCEIAKPENSGWRIGSRRIVAWLGDAPGHDPITVDGVEYSIDKAIKELVHANVGVVAFSVISGGDQDGKALDETGQATTITVACDDEVAVKTKVGEVGIVSTIFNFIKSENS